MGSCLSVLKRVEHLKVFDGKLGSIGFWKRLKTSQKFILFRLNRPNFKEELWDFRRI